MSRKRGGLIGKPVIPTGEAPNADASGIWNLNDVVDSEVEGIQPQTDYGPTSDGNTIVISDVQEAGTYSFNCQQNFSDSEGVANLTFSLNSGTLPAGVSLSTAGMLTGPPDVVAANTGDATYDFDIKATDSPLGQTAIQTYRSTITKQPIDAVWSDWSGWSHANGHSDGAGGTCSVACDIGTQSSTRTCTEQLYGGTTCANTDGGNSSRSQDCNTQSCWTATVASGGDEIIYVNSSNEVTTEALGTYKIHVFNNTSYASSNAGFRVASVGTDATCEYVTVAGGGGSAAGAGGAGGYRSSYASESSGGGAGTESKATITATNYDVVIGAGGTGGSAANQLGTNGDDSSVFGITSIGGGDGGCSTYGTHNAGSGGSGGGAGAGDPDYQYPRRSSAGSGTTGQGYAGRTANTWGQSSFGAGGGGAAGTPTDNNGGPGLTTYIVGTGGKGLAGGGAGVTTSATGSHGGGDYHTNGDANTGGGAGAYRWGCTSGKNGGKGVVYIRYQYQ